MHVSIHIRCVARTVYNYYRLLVSTTLLGVSWRGGSSSRKVYPRLLERLASAKYCLFLQGVSKQIEFLLSLDSQPRAIWTLT